MLDKLERKLGKYAIPRLMNYIIGGYVLGYILSAIQAVTGAGILSLMTLEPYYICHGQIWRLVTWIMIPPEQNIIYGISGNDIHLYDLSRPGPKPANRFIWEQHELCTLRVKHLLKFCLFRLTNKIRHRLSIKKVCKQRFHHD